MHKEKLIKSLDKFLYIPRMRPVAYVISGADLAGSLAKELIRA